MSGGTAKKKPGSVTPGVRIGARPLVALAVTALLASLPLGACGPYAQPEDSVIPAVQTAQPQDVRGRILAALEQPGMIARVEYDFQIVVHGLVTFESNVAWLDIGRDTVRLETGNPPTILLMTPDVQAEYSPRDNSLSESPRRKPVSTSYPPQWSEKESIGALGPLGVALNYGNWTSMVSVDVGGRQTQTWTVEDLPQGDIGDTRMKVWIDANDSLPIKATISPERVPTDTQVSMAIDYAVEFVSPDDLPKNLFDLDAVRRLPLTFGGQLDSAKALPFPVYWLGRTSNFAIPFPQLALTRLQIQAGEPQRTTATPEYRTEASKPGEAVGSVSMVQWSRALFESTLFYGGGSQWWTGRDVDRVAAVIDGVPAEFVIVDTGIRPPDPAYPPIAAAPPPPPPNQIPMPPPLATPTPNTPDGGPTPGLPVRPACAPTVGTRTVLEPPGRQTGAPASLAVPTPTSVGSWTDPACAAPAPSNQPVPTVSIDTKPRRFMRAMVWTPSTVISLEATPMWIGTEARDANVFNSPEGLDALIRAFKAMR